MNNTYTAAQTGGTYGLGGAALMLLLQFGPSANVGVSLGRLVSPILPQAYYAEFASETPSSVDVRLAESVEENFDLKVAKFFDQLTLDQRPLRGDFAAILVENMWDLYA
jgi:hypothetical protein